MLIICLFIYIIVWIYLLFLAWISHIASGSYSQTITIIKLQFLPLCFAFLHHNRFPARTGKRIIFLLPISMILKPMALLLFLYFLLSLKFIIEISLIIPWRFNHKIILYFQWFILFCFAFVSISAIIVFIYTAIYGWFCRCIAMIVICVWICIISTVVVIFRMIWSIGYWCYWCFKFWVYWLKDSILVFEHNDCNNILLKLINYILYLYTYLI